MPFSPPNIELEAIARTPVEASREVNCAYFGNIGRNSGGFLFPIILVVHPTVHPGSLAAKSNIPDRSFQVEYGIPAYWACSLTDFMILEDLGANT